MGFQRSQYTLGKMHVYGLGVIKDPAVAITWVQKAGDAGFAAAQ